MEQDFYRPVALHGAQTNSVRTLGLQSAVFAVVCVILVVRSLCRFADVCAWFLVCTASFVVANLNNW